MDKKYLHFQVLITGIGSEFQDEQWTRQRNLLHPDGLWAMLEVPNTGNLSFMLGCINIQHVQPQEKSIFSHW